MYEGYRDDTKYYSPMTEKDMGKENLNIGQRIIVFIGPEGSGKTTMAKELAKEGGKPYITTGDIIRDLAANDAGSLGEECREMFSTNTYLAGETLLKILTHRFAREDTENGFVLDGGLRTLEETVNFQNMLDTAKRALPLTIIYLQIPNEISIERLVVGENARKRVDDTIGGVENRLSKFYFQLEERLDHVNDQPNWDLVEIDATGSVEDVFSQVAVSLRVSL